MNDQPRCTMVMYHYVRNMHETDYPDIKGLLIKKFIRQLDYILKNYTVIGLPDYIGFLYGNKDIPKNSCVLIFDDGFRDHYVNVFPILQKRKLPACFFPTTQPLKDGVAISAHKAHFLLAKIGTKIFVDEFNQVLKSKFPELAPEFVVEGGEKKEKKYRWDDALTANLKYSIGAMPSASKTEITNQIFARYFKDEKGFCKELYLGFEEMREMVKGGMSFGGHTHTHPRLSRLSQEEQIRELKNPKELLEKELQTEINSFSYPHGDFNEAIVALLKSEGYACAATADVGVNTGNNLNPFVLKILNTNDLPQ